MKTQIKKLSLIFILLAFSKIAHGNVGFTTDERHIYSVTCDGTHSVISIHNADTLESKTSR